MKFEEIQEKFKENIVAKSSGLLTESCVGIKNLAENSYAVILHDYMTGTYQILKVNVQTLKIDFVFNDKGTTLFDRVEASTAFRQLY
jgi:hypothetical protein